MWILWKLPFRIIVKCFDKKLQNDYIVAIQFLETLPIVWQSIVINRGVRIEIDQKWNKQQMKIKRKRNWRFEKKREIVNKLDQMSNSNIAKKKKNDTTSKELAKESVQLKNASNVISTPVSSNIFYTRFIRSENITIL